jgi:hypothetical protein
VLDRVGGRFRRRTRTALRYRNYTTSTGPAATGNYR